MSKRYQLEGPAIYKLRYNLMENNILFTEEMSSKKTPYRQYGSSIEIEIQNDLDIPKFLKLAELDQIENQTRIYSMEEGIPRPVIFENKQMPLFQTTFFFKQLQKSEQFLYLDRDICDRNFLETFETKKDNYGNIEGYYRASAYLPGGEYLTCTDTGTFTSDCICEVNNYTIETTMKNIRYYIGPRCYMTPYDILFSIPDVNGVSETKLVEHYVQIFSNLVIHYADNLDIIEVYEIRDRQMNKVPHQILSEAMEPSTELDKLILSCVKELKNKQPEQKRNKYRKPEEV